MDKRTKEELKCRCDKLNQLSMTIAQDIWDSFAKHLGEDSGLDSDETFMCSAVAVTCIIEEMANSAKDPYGEVVGFKEMIHRLYQLYLDKEIESAMGPQT